jgi:hypothetical protein
MSDHVEDNDDEANEGISDEHTFDLSNDGDSNDNDIDG